MLVAFATVLTARCVDGMTRSSFAKAAKVETMRAPRITIPSLVSLTIFAARSWSCRSTGFERSTCGLTRVCVRQRSLSRTNT